MTKRGPYEKDRKPRPDSPIAGARFGYLVADHFVKMNGRSRNQVWLFKCDCGREKERDYSEVKLGRFEDCGCRPPTRVQRAVLFRGRFKGMSAFDAELLALRVEGVCEVCGEPEIRIHPQTGNKQFLCVDHCHETGSVRGVLCSKCNSAEGHLRGLANVRRLVAYLEKAEALARMKFT